MWTPGSGVIFLLGPPIGSVWVAALVGLDLHEGGSCGGLGLI